MARTLLDHACEHCGKIRKVSPDKLAKGLQRVCRQCQGQVAADKRRLAMIKRGGPKHVTYGFCLECRATYEMRPIDDDGHCSDQCRTAALQRGHSASKTIRWLLSRQWIIPKDGTTL